MLKSPPLVIDTGIVSRYSFTNRVDILKELYGDNIIIPSDVLTECWKVEPMQNALKSALTSGWLQQYTIDFVSDVEIVATFGRLTKRFGHGESAVLSIAKIKECTVGSDDMRAARKFCEKNYIPLMGSLGILYDAYDKEIITESEGNTIHADMIKWSRYNSPISNFREAIDWFENGQGRRLY